MRIGIDMDGTLTNPYGMWQAYFNHAEGRLHDHAESCLPYPPTWEYHRELCVQCFNKVLANEDMVRFARLQPDAGGAIERFAAFGKLYLITHRPPEFISAVCYMLRINDLFDHFEDIYVGWADKGEIAGPDGFNVDLLIDDKPDNLVSAMRAGVAPLCFAAPYNESVRAPRCWDWREAVDHIIDNYGHLADLSASVADLQAWKKG